MSRVTRIIPALFALLAVSAVAGAQIASAQAAPLPVAEAQAFMGSWAIALDAQGQTLVMNLKVQDLEGNVSAEVGSDMTPTTTSESASKSGEKLVLNFMMEAEGQQFPVVMTLTPEGDALNANVDFAGGMFVAMGKGTKM